MMFFAAPFFKGMFFSSLNPFEGTTETWKKIEQCVHMLGVFLDYINWSNVHLMSPFKYFSSWDKGHFAVHSATLGWMKTSAIDLSWVRRRKVKPSDRHTPEG